MLNFVISSHEKNVIAYPIYFVFSEINGERRHPVLSILRHLPLLLTIKNIAQPCRAEPSGARHAATYRQLFVMTPFHSFPRQKYVNHLSRFSGEGRA